MKKISKRLPSELTMAIMSFRSCLSGFAIPLLCFRWLWTRFFGHIFVNLSSCYLMIFWYTNVYTKTMSLIWKLLSIYYSKDNFSSSSPSVLLLRPRSNTWGTWCQLMVWNQSRPRFRLFFSGPPHSLKGHCKVFWDLRDFIDVSSKATPPYQPLWTNCWWRTNLFGPRKLKLPSLI